MDFLRLGKEARLSDNDLKHAEAAHKYKTTLWVNGPVSEDPFYKVPRNSERSEPGSLLKVEEDADASKYILPPATSISRILYTSRALFGKSVPASAYILWPYSPHPVDDGYPVVVWAHSRSGIFGDAAPSHLKNLHTHYVAPYPLATNGFVVVAPDYAGLGVTANAAGEPIVHEFLANPSQANDVVYAMEAARQAFPKLSPRFVVLGQSQGGGAAWSAAERQAHEPVPGYLGAIAVSPIPNVLEPLDRVTYTAMLGVLLAPALTALYPTFDPDAFLTPLGRQLLAIHKSSGGTTSSGWLGGDDTLQPGWQQNGCARDYISRAANGGRRIGGPLLIVEGEADSDVELAATTAAVNRTRVADPGADIEFLRLPGLTHHLAFSGAQRIWMQWILDRFAGEPPRAGYFESRAEPARPPGALQEQRNWHIAPSEEDYHTFY